MPLKLPLPVDMGPLSHATEHVQNLADAHVVKEVLVLSSNSLVLSIVKFLFVQDNCNVRNVSSKLVGRWSILPDNLPACFLLLPKNFSIGLRHELVQPLFGNRLDVRVVVKLIIGLL